jgi:hypothetical protein
MLVDGTHTNSSHEERWKQSVFLNLRTKKKEQNKNNTKMIDLFRGRTLEEGITNSRPCTGIVSSSF